MIVCLLVAALQVCPSWSLLDLSVSFFFFSWTLRYCALMISPMCDVLEPFVTSSMYLLFPCCVLQNLCVFFGRFGDAFLSARPVVKYSISSCDTRVHGPLQGRGRQNMVLRAATVSKFLFSLPRRCHAPRLPHSMPCFWVPWFVWVA